MLESMYIGNRDGGIINTLIQAPQTGDPFVFIGLGGTGVDAISHLKTKLKHQIIPDNVDRVKTEGEEPEYQHIKFLGIDADSCCLKKSGLNDTECLNIQNYDYPVVFAEDKLDALKKQKELQWMSTDYLASHLLPHPDEAGAYRQFGRWLTVSKAEEIRSKIYQVVTAANTGGTGKALTVHIISGISGGMGGGSFADVCYITRSVIENLGIQGANIFGYFVLPDAICSKPSIVGDPVQMNVNQRNGMASLLEIEHLMNLKDSNEWFEQDYGNGFSIKTQSKLVDICYLVSATHIQGVLVPNGYEYVLNVIGDYIFSFISKDAGTGISMEGHLLPVMPHFAKIDPANDRGYSQNYHLLGSATAEIPTTQMATYLASELFKKLTISKDMPTDLQIKQEFADYLILTDNKVPFLEKVVESGASWIPVDKKTVEQYFAQIKANRNNNGIPLPIVQRTENSLKYRKGVLNQNRKSAEKEIDPTYLWQNNATSIPGLAFNKLIEMIEDPAKGPIYAYGMMNNKTGADIFAYLDGRKLTYSKLKTEALNQVTLFMGKEPEAKRALADANFFNKSARIDEYTKVLNNTYHWQAKADFYEMMEKLMTNLITSFKNINDTYLKPLYQITNELIETFEANSTYFSMGKGDQSQDGFTKQLVRFSEIQPILDEEICQLNLVEETRRVLKILTTTPKIWMEHQEVKLKAEISEYILGKFHPILTQSLEDFLRWDWNMHAATPQQFAAVIQSQIIKPLVDAAAPIFWTSEPMVQNKLETVHRSILTVPSEAYYICLAADDWKGIDSTIDIRKSLINDKICVFQTISGVPMHAYLGLFVYFDAYDQYKERGIHLYENNPNWRETLTFPCPYSYIPQYTKNAAELLALYKDAEEKGIIYYSGPQAYVKRLNDISEIVFNFDSLENNGKIDLMKVDAKIQELQALLTQTQEPFEINSRGNSSTNNPNNSDPADHANTLVKDNFLRFYGIQQAVKAEVEKYDQIQQALEDLQNKLTQENTKVKLRKVVFDAILSDVFTEKDGMNVFYDYVQFGMQQQEVLCANGMPFAGRSKYYQVFKSVQDLDAAVQNQLTSETDAKFNAMTVQAKWDKIEKLMGIYTSALVGMIVNNFAENLEQSEVQQFYQEFNNYLTQIKIQLTMMGLTSNNS